MRLNNMMYRKRHDNSKRKCQIFGVLNDFDLSSLIPLKEATCLHRTGTPPYMAYDLLGQVRRWPSVSNMMSKRSTMFC